MIKNYFLISLLLLAANLFAQDNSSKNEEIRSSHFKINKSEVVLAQKLQQPNDKEISIYPNPTTINSISLNTSKNLSVNIYNVLGQNVLSTTVTTQNNKINIETLKSGVYIIKLKSNSDTVTKKLIKK